LARIRASDYRFLRVEEIPEEISLDALLAVLASMPSQDSNLRVSDVTDRVFSTLFYSHLWPVLAKTWPSESASDRLLWTIRNIPFRKFKSAIPLLLTGSHRCSIAPALAAELVFALFYLLDDVIDQRTHRYGRKTALGAGGVAETATSIMLGLTAIDQWLASMQASTSLRQTIREGARALADEQNFRRGRGARSLEQYAEHSKRRTRFLGDLWAVACQESDCEAEASLIRRVYGTCALAGQIKNDLRDIRAAEPEERFRDIRDGVRNACLLRLLEVTGEVDRGWLTGRLATRSPLTIDDETELVRLFAEHEVDAWATSYVRALGKEILASVDRADVVESKKRVLAEWVTLQFMSGLDSISDDSPTRVRQFVEAVAELTQGLQTQAPRAEL
jgi:geranylgeranyl pyrophosphate synthase